MFHSSLTTGCSVVLMSLMMPTTYAQEYGQYGAYPMSPVAQYAPQGNYYGQGQSPQYFQQVSAQTPTQAPAPMGGDPALDHAGFGPQQQQGYVRVGAPMYPSPRPNIPIWAGSTVITNQALAPHEMLYPHTYRAIYPPFYHRVKGGWLLTPFGVRSHEKWELQGTMVQVKYRSHYPGILSGSAWFPPLTGNSIGSWR